MATDKRQRQRANRQLKYEEQVKVDRRRSLTRRLVIGAVAVIGGVALVLLIAWAVGRDDGGDEEEVGGFAYGSGECAPEEVTEPVRTFEEAPERCIDTAATYTARFVTDRGDVVVELDTAEVPGTVNNFVTLARYGYYDDTLLFRTDPSIGIVQGGGRSNSDSPGYEIPDEASGFTYQVGQIAMARTGAPNSAGGQWFFNVTDAASALDAQGTYVVFGQVTEGLDVLEEVLALAPETGDTPTEEVVVETVEITES